MKRRSLSKGSVFKLLGALLTAVTAAHAEPGAALASADAALRNFLRDPELCAYMVSPPDGESAALLRRYERAAQAAVQQLRRSDASLSETAALFRLRAACEQSLDGSMP